LAGQRPLVEAQTLGQSVDAVFLERGSAWRRELFAPLVANVCFGRTKVGPVGLRLDARPVDGHEATLHAEQALDRAF